MWSGLFLKSWKTIQLQQSKDHSRLIFYCIEMVLDIKKIKYCCCLKMEAFDVLKIIPNKYLILKQNIFFNKKRIKTSYNKKLHYFKTYK